MHKPHYDGGSIVNLMSSVSSAFGHKTRYRNLSILPASLLRKKKNVLLIVMDGLGYEFLRKRKDSFLWQNTRGSITSVFPSTTTAAITSFVTGEAPAQHSFTGWFMNSKETGSVISPLLGEDRAGGMKLDDKGISLKSLLGSKPLAEKLKTDMYNITPSHIKGTAYTDMHTPGVTVYGYRSLEGFTRRIKEACNKEGEKFVFAYWPEFDTVSHEEGINSEAAEEHFRIMDDELKALISRLEDTEVIITADHGLVDTDMGTELWLEDHPELEECLSVPLCGEPRAVFCYVHPAEDKRFRDYVRKHLKDKCYIYKSEELLRKGFFGKFRENERLRHRIGDYTLLMKKNYILKDRLVNEEKNSLVGIHGGISREEMHVPLIVVER
ncbi:MAG: alkaline phosphatase family protein [Nanobdellota archaeon]